MAKKDREKKRAERAENATPQNIARKEERAKEKKEAEEKLAARQRIDDGSDGILGIGNIRVIICRYCQTVV